MGRLTTIDFDKSPHAKRPTDVQYQRGLTRSVPSTAFRYAITLRR